MRPLSALAWLLPFLAAACAVPPRDPFARANWSLQRGDLGGALIAYDSVPVAHARYPDARAGAIAVERSMRRCHELLLEALLMRSEWRDQDALAMFERAQALWPQLPGVDGWIAATRQRLRSLPAASPLAEVSAVDSEPIPVPWIEIAEPRPVPLLPADGIPGQVVAPAPEPTVEPVEPTAMPSPQPTAMPSPQPATPPAAAQAAAPAAAPDSAEVRLPEPRADVATNEPSPAPVEERPAPPLSAAGNDPVALGLVDVESKLRSGQLQLAVTSLIGLSDRFPGDTRVRVRLARLLQQRALLRYGEGAVPEAIADWKRVLELEPTNEGVRRMLGAALRESQRGP